MKFRLLRADEIDCRVGNVIDTANFKGFTLLLYKDARCDMDILDETVGENNWQRDHKEIKGNLYGGVSIWDETKNEWVTKWDCGTESNTEKEKGEASDSFKRACVNWGIGRELYTSPRIFIKDHLKEDKKGHLIPDFKKMEVREIGYNDKREINHIIITGDGEIIFELSAKGVSAPKSAPQPTKTETAEIPSMTPKQAAQAEFDRIVFALDYGVQGKTSIKKFKTMTDDEIEICKKSGNQAVREMAEVISNAMDEDKIFYNDDTGLLEVVPF